MTYKVKTLKNIAHTTYCNLYSLCKWERPKCLFFVVKRYAVCEAKNGGTQYAIPK